MMAPEPDVLKRKRSRPSDWWAASPAQPTPPQQNEPPAKKRGQSSLGGGGRTIQEVLGAANCGKKSKSKDDAPSAEQDSDEPAKPLRRGRPSNTETELQVAATASVDRDEVGRKRRGRRPVAQEGREEEQEDVRPPSKDQSTPKKRGRPQLPQADELAEVDLSNRDVESVKHFRRGHSSNTEAELQAAVGSSTKEPATRKTRTGRSDAEIEQPVIDKSPPKGNFGSRKGGQEKIDVEVASSSLARSKKTKPAKTSKIMHTNANARTPEIKQPAKSKKRGRPSNADVLDRTGSASAQSKRTNSGRPSNPEISKHKRKEMDEAEDSNRLKRSRHEKDSQEGHIARLPAYQHLAAVTRHVPRHTIEAKWEPLTPACVDLVSQLLQDIQKPVVVRHNNEHRRIQASTALEMVSRRLVSKLSKGLPFPQGTRSHREDDFDFEKILDHNRALESQLTPTLHANEILEAEILKETALLELEQAALAELDANAKVEASKRKEAGRKLHSLLQTDDSTIEEEGLKTHIGLDFDHKSPPLALKIESDEGLETIFNDLTGHVDSIQGNLNQVGGITKAIAKSRAAVQGTLFDHLENMQYEEMILG